MTVLVKFIKDMREYNPEAKLIFANGGDRQPGTTLEEKAGFEKITFAFAVGGTDKKNFKQLDTQRLASTKSRTLLGTL